MFCIRCGKQNPDDARFCNGCGNPALAYPQTSMPIMPQAVYQSASPPSQPLAVVYPQVSMPIQSPQKSSKKKWIWRIAGLVAVMAIVGKCTELNSVSAAVDNRGESSQEPSTVEDGVQTHENKAEDNFPVAK